MIGSPRAQGTAIACGVLAGVLASGAGGHHPQAPWVLAVLRCAGAVALVACACAVTALAVRAVSRRYVVRHHDGDDEPPLPFHQPEPAGEQDEDAWPPPPPRRQAAPLPLPGRSLAPRRQVAVPEPDPEEVPR